MIFKIDDEMMETDPYEKARSTFATVNNYKQNIIR